ncbi:hypothetical protein GCM10010467_12640 [Actinocorallia glomerata]|uniref:Uncharacterized protein n=2 Tax=Actinomycetes TaxID=1760 RepID=A0ABP6LSQ0_9MICC
MPTLLIDHHEFHSGGAEVHSDDEGVLEAVHPHQRIGWEVRTGITGPREADLVDRWWLRWRRCPVPSAQPSGDP